MLTIKPKLVTTAEGNKYRVLTRFMVVLGPQIGISFLTVTRSRKFLAIVETRESDCPDRQSILREASFNQGFIGYTKYKHHISYPLHMGEAAKAYFYRKEAETEEAQTPFIRRLIRTARKHDQSSTSDHS